MCIFIYIKYIYIDLHSYMSCSSTSKSKNFSTTTTDGTTTLRQSCMCTQFNVFYTFYTGQMYNSTGLQLNVSPLTSHLFQF
jgi:hypothetical protein